MPFTAMQIENQIKANFIAIDRLKAQFQLNMPIWKAVQLEQEVNRIAQAQKYWTSEYYKVTGRAYMIVAESVIVGDPEEENREQRKAAAAADIKKIKAKQSELVAEALYHVDQDFQRLLLNLQSQYDIAVQWQHALFSHWVRTGAGCLDVRHPLILKKQVEDAVRKAVAEAKQLMGKGKYTEAFQKAAYASRWIKWGFDGLASYMAKLDTGGARVVAGIKVSAALAGIIAAAPLEAGALTVWGSMKVAAAAEAGIQGTTLLANAADPGFSVTLVDVRQAAFAVAINGAAVGAGKLGAWVAKGIGSMVLSRILEKAVSNGKITEELRAKAMEFVLVRIEAYVTANATAIVSKMLKTDTNVDWNWWYMAVAPAFNGITIEMAKEPDLQTIFKKDPIKPGMDQHLKPTLDGFVKTTQARLDQVGIR